MRYQVGDLWVALENLADQILAQVLAAFETHRKFGEQPIVALEEIGMAGIEDLLGFT